MPLTAGTQLGPYEVVEPLGAGGMGEVYRARDPRLGREVAVKLVATEGEPSPDRLRRFETEARAAAQLSHPNVVTVFDVGTHEGRPYLVLELLEGETLRETLHGGIPPLRQAVVWALDVSRGLAAAHERGIVHRDLKPENVFLTRDGRVKVLDFGLAKLHEPLVSGEADRESPTATFDTSPGVLLGTIGYMSPEQAKGETPDLRTDVFTLGSVLYEMVTGRRAFGGSTSAEVLASILRDEPPALESLQPGVPASLEAVVRRCLAKRPADRFSSARAVEAALETVLASLEPSRVSVSRPGEPRGPYPGLSSFTEADAERFFGREAEVEALWTKLRRDRLLALIGPSGAGKTSFVRAGLVPSRPSGWGAIVATPGSAPMRSLAQALVEELPSDADTMKQLLGFEEPDVGFSMVRKWRESHLEALLVVDQFEEVFTLNPPEVQERFAELLGHLSREGDVHVLLSLRDDFLMRCHDHEALEKVFEHLTPLGPLSEDGLRRALIEPAKKEGFAFEDESLVDGMLESVADARGALPLLAFAVARLWEKRDRENKLLTRKAYEEIGGVAGALAQHAEQTMERIGLEREPIVRELFRNLVTAQWTRAVADREELLSVLPDQEAGAQVLDQLIDARLLTSYEVREAQARRPKRAGEMDGAEDLSGSRASGSSALAVSRHRIEIVHESLLRAWPRLVRWQAQDEEGAVLRDQLKQAARLWEEKGRPDDLLWTGTSEREFELWQDRYPGALTALEDDFAKAMVHRARRRKRLRQIALVTFVVGLSAVAAAIAVSRQQTARARDEARAEARRAEASKLLALAQLQLEEEPTEALAYATASLEVSDTHEARVFAMKALWEAPPALELSVARPPVLFPTFSADGRWVAAGHFEGAIVWSQTGDRVAVLREEGRSPGSVFSLAVWGPRGLLLTGRFLTDHVEVWSVPSGERVRTIEFGGPSRWGLARERLVAATLDGTAEAAWRRGIHAGVRTLRSWQLPGGDAHELGQVDATALGASSGIFEPNGGGWLYTKGRTIVLRPFPMDGRGDLVVSHLDSKVTFAGPLEDGAVVFREESGRVHTCCSLTEGRPTLTQTFSKPETAEGPVFPERSGRWLIESTSDEPRPRLWSTAAWPGARPLFLRRGTDLLYPAHLGFHPTGAWHAASTNDGANLTFWPLRRSYPTVVDGYGNLQRPVVFSPDSRWLATNWQREGRLWPVGQKDGRHSPLDLPEGTSGFDRAFGPENRFLFVARSAPALVVPLDGSPVRPLEGFPEGTVLLSAAVSPSGRRVAAAFNCCGPEKTLRVWDLETGDVGVLDLPKGATPDGMTPVIGLEWAIASLAFVGESTLYSGGAGGIRRWNLDDGSHELILASRPGYVLNLRLGAGGRRGLAHQGRMDNERECLPVELVDLRAGRSEPLPEFGACPQLISGFALDASGTIAATADQDGLVRVGRLGDGEPHVLAGHDGAVQSVAISPDLRWVASAGWDRSLRLWPMPDLSKPPLHTLPHGELIAKLKSLTNLRAVRDPEAPNGWTITLDPFPGWKSVPEW